MRNTAFPAAAVLAVLPLVLSGVPGLAQSAASQPASPDIPANPHIEVKYVPPPADNVEFTAIYNDLVKRKPLETLQQFLAPLKLDQTLTIEVDQCGGATYAPHTHGGPVKICYEFVKEISSLAPRAPIKLIQTEGHMVKPDVGTVGPFVQEMLHEVAIGLFDILNVPVWGRQDDAADRLTAFILVNFPQNDMAWNTIVGTAWYLSASALSPPDLTDVRGITAERYYTTLCIAFGGDKKTFGSFVLAARQSISSGDPFFYSDAAGDLPNERANGCPGEYAAEATAFDKLIKPHVDTDLMQKVRATQWLNFND